MEESEKMVALQKAYADIILNTAKEAAARIMVSERRAVRFELDLKNTKDEAFRLLLRLKQMIDSKTKEAEIASLTKQRKIDELEAQLNEAEDVITDLRTELRWVRNKLEKVKSNQLLPPKEKITHSPTAESTIRSISNSGVETVITSDGENTVLNQRILDNRCCSGALQTDNLGVCHLENHDDQKYNLASIVRRSKEPELYRSERTQRTHALERNLLNDKVLSLAGVDGQYSLVKSESIIETSNKDVGKSTVTSPWTKNIDAIKKFSGETKKLVKVRTLRRRKTRFGKSKANLRRSRPGQPIKPCHPSISSRTKPYSLNGNVKSEVSARPLPSVKACNTDNVKSSSGLDEKLQHKSSLNEDETMIIHKGKRNMKVQGRDVTNASFVSPNQLIKPCQTTSVVKHGMIYSFAVRGNVKSGEDGAKIENEAKMKPLPRLDPGLTLIRSGVNPLSGSTGVSVSVKALNKSRVALDASEKETELRIESTMVKPEAVAFDNSNVVFSELDPDMVDLPVALSDSKDDKSFSETNGTPSKPDSNRFLKYTFQRKRKKESLSNSNGNTSPDKTIEKKRATEKPDDPPEPQKLFLINASSRDSRRLAQVARQLISLSGKRW